VGWNKPVGFGDGWGSAQASFNFRSEWMQDWYYYWTIRGLWQAFDNACDAASWPPNRQTQLWGTMRVYGYTNLLMNGYNQKTDWRWP
jgi:hypothetical protein